MFKNWPKKPKHRRVQYALLLLFCVGSALFVALMLLRHEVMYFGTPDALWANPPAWRGRSVRVGGHVAPDSLKSLESGGVTFTLQDKIHALDVTFEGLLPALFREGQSTVVEGTFHPDRRIFEAKVVLAKHDEKYEPRGHAAPDGRRVL